MCGDKAMHKCLPSSVGNTEDRHSLRFSLHYPKHPGTFRYSPSLILSLGTKLGLVYLHSLTYTSKFNFSIQDLVGTD